MLKSFREHILAGFYVAVIATGLLLAAGKWLRLPAVQAQWGDKTIDLLDAQGRGNPVVVTRVMVGDTNVQCGLLDARYNLLPVVPFRAGDDWLQNTTIFLLNRTNKNIVAAHLGLGFPETGDGQVQPQFSFSIDLGRLPEVDAISGRTGQSIPEDSERKPLAWVPGQTMAIHLGDFREEIKGGIADHISPASVSKLRIHIGPFFFADGMRWNAGLFAVPDSSHPGKFMNMPDDYFPGDPLVNWIRRKL